MKIRTRLTLQFFFIVASILFFSLLAIFLLSAQYRKREFYDRLNSHAETTADFLISVNQIDSSLLRIIDKTRKDVLPEENITIYGTGNKVLYTNNDSLFFSFDKSIFSRIKKEGRVEWTQDKYEIIGILYYEKNARFIIIAGAADTYGIRKLKYLELILVIVFVVVQCVVAFAGWIYAGKALQPINKMVNEVNTISGSDLNTRIESGKGKDEISRLAETFNRMLERIQEAFAIQKSFVSNASHELKNPLTTITSQLEVALMRSRTPEEYRSTLESVLDDMRDLNNVARRLLELTGLTTPELKVHFVHLRIDEVLWQCKEEVEKRNTEWKIIFSPDLPEDSTLLEFEGNESLMKTAFINIMENGCKFSPLRTVEVKLKLSPENITVSFVDEGIGIPEEDLESIFQPFYRGSNASSVSGHGIGLSVVARILTLHRIRFALVSSPGKGTDFTVVIPCRKSGAQV